MTDGPAIGVASHPKTSYPDLIAAAAGADVDFVELMLEGPGERRRLADRADAITDALPPSMGLVTHLPFSGVDIGAPLEHVRDGSIRELRAGIELTADLGGTKAVFHADTSVRPEIWAREPVRTNLFEAVERVHGYGQEQSVAALPENVPGPFVSVETFPTLFDRTTASMTLDTGHARVSGFDDDELAAFVADYGDRIAHLHLNDTRGPRDEHLPVGMGETDFAAIIGALPDGWSGTMTVEALTSDFEYVETGLRRLRSLLE